MYGGHISANEGFNWDPVGSPIPTKGPSMNLNNYLYIYKHM